MDKLYGILKDSSEHIFLYCVIIVICIFCAMRFNVTLNSLLGLVIGFIIIYGIYYYFLEQQNTFANKLNSVGTQLANYPELVDVLYHIKNVTNNKREYDELVLYIFAFTQLYSDSQQGLKYCQANYENASDLLDNAMNSLIVLMIDSYYSTEAQDIVSRILNSYLEDMRKTCNTNIAYTYRNGKIWTGPKAYNY